MAEKRKNLHLTIATPQAQIFDTGIFDATLPAHDGLIGIMMGHAPIVCKLKPGVMRFHETGQPRVTTIFVDGGFFDVHENHIVVLTPRVIRRNEMTVEQAREILRQAEALAHQTGEQAAAQTSHLERARELLKFIQKD
ncbi:MAG: ATP synthase F1 subunit epsilon [Sedimentisphaerales bacterium]|nr:ATP synthase F1 subunit epsilon [Sedimentisphaerales bacterium]